MKLRLLQQGIVERAGMHFTTECDILWIDDDGLPSFPRIKDLWLLGAKVEIAVTDNAQEFLIVCILSLPKRKHHPRG